MLWFHEIFKDIGNSVLVGPNDASYGIRAYWGASYVGENPFTLERDPLNGAPEGMPWSRAVQYANALIPGSIWLLHYLVGFGAAANLYLLIGFVLTASPPTCCSTDSAFIQSGASSPASPSRSTRG